jgi:3-methyladenine DNA glycosylase AlkD
MDISTLVEDLQQRLQQAANEKTRLWWEGYLKHEIRFRGVGLPTVRTCVEAWRRETGLADEPLEVMMETTMALFMSEIAEDKLAGVVCAERYIRDKVPGSMIIDCTGQVFENRLIHDWSTCDWFCVRVLGPKLRDEGLPFARALEAWSREQYLWHARAALIPFTAVAGEKKYRAIIGRIAARLVARPERFAKTAVGWVLREIEAHDRAFVVDFVRAHAAALSVEAARNALKHVPSEESAPLIALVK